MSNPVSASAKEVPHSETIRQDRRKLTWFLGFVIVVLVITGTTDLIFSFYGSPNVAKERNPFMTVEYTPTPSPFQSTFLAPTQQASNSPQIITPTPSKKTDTICTMDAKMCPDGKTFVGRSGPKCEFVACPTPKK